MRIMGIPDSIDKDTPQSFLEKILEPTLIEAAQETGHNLPYYFVSCLLHGNEPAGYFAVFDLLKEISRHPEKLPANFLFFIGNVPDALCGRPFSIRYSSVDFNRIWGTGHVFSRDLFGLLQKYDIKAVLDLHENSGKNPLYSCVSSPNSWELAEFLCNRHIYFDFPSGILTQQFSCPSVGIETGKMGTDESLANARKMLEKFLEYARMKENDCKVPANQGEYYAETVFCKMLPGVSFCAGKGNAEFCIREDVEDWNFKMMKKGEFLGKASKMPVLCTLRGNDVTEEYLEINSGQLMLKKDAYPIMATMHTENISKSALCFFVQKVAKNDI